MDFVNRVNIRDDYAGFGGNGGNEIVHFGEQNILNRSGAGGHVTRNQFDEQKVIMHPGGLQYNYMER
jgi:hypothetical protein